MNKLLSKPRGQIESPQKHQAPTSLKKAPSETKEVEFYLKASGAKSVRLAADFTDWEKASLPMSRADNGFWFAIVPLTPGEYNYRFIVDGQWSDDPHSNRQVPNSFGTLNAVKTVA